MKLTLSHRAKPSERVLVQEVGGEAVLLNVSTERYFGLDPVGTRIWSLLADDARLVSVYDAMLAEYDAEPAQLEADLLSLIEKLATAGLVQVE